MKPHELVSYRGQVGTVVYRYPSGAVEIEFQNGSVMTLEQKDILTVGGSARETYYLIWSFEHRMWWRPYDSGYTSELSDAGLYTFEEASRVCKAHWFPYSPGFGHEINEAMIPFCETMPELRSVKQYIADKKKGKY